MTHSMHSTNFALVDVVFLSFRIAMTMRKCEMNRCARFKMGFTLNPDSDTHTHTRREHELRSGQCSIGEGEPVITSVFGWSLAPSSLVPYLSMCRFLSKWHTIP